MRRLVDTSAWIEWLIGTPTGAAVAPMIPSPDDWLVPTIVQLELTKWLTREVGEDKADSVLAFTQTCQVAVLDTRTAITAAQICRERRLATADAIVYATAQEHGVEIVTCDAHFRELPGVLFIAKTTR